MHPSAGTPTVTYKAAFNPEDEMVTVVRDVRAGVSGPCDEYPAVDLETADRALFDAGYLTATPWSAPSSLGDQWCDLTLMR